MEKWRRMAVWFLAVALLSVNAGVLTAKAADGPGFSVLEPFTERCPGLGSLEDVEEGGWSFFSLSPEAKEFNGRYYEQLDDTSKDLYDLFYGWYRNGADLSKHTLEITNEFTGADITMTSGSKYSVNDERIMAWCRDSIVPAVLALIYDHPEMSWLVNAPYSYSASMTGSNFSEDKTKADIKVDDVSFWFTGSNVGTKAEMDAAVLRAREAIEQSDVSTVQKKIRAMHDYLAETITYNNCAGYVNGTLSGKVRTYSKEELNAYQTAYSAFYPCNGDDVYFGAESNYTVCAGYARGFKLLCDAYGIPCAYVTGTTPSGGHAWNYVQLSGNWYAVDCTWDDQAGKTIYAYFLTGSTSMGIHGQAFSDEHISSGEWLAGYTFYYPSIAPIKYCEHVDRDDDGTCDDCGRVTAVSLSVAQEGWTYGNGVKAPVEMVSGIDDYEECRERYGCSFSYKKKGEPDSSYTADIPKAAGDYTVQAVLPQRCDESYDYPEMKATADFTIGKALLSIAEVDVSGKIYDGKDEAQVLGVMFRGLAEGDCLLPEQDYRVSAAFADVNAGADREVRGTVTVINKNYCLESGSFQTTATIERASLSPEPAGEIAAVYKEGLKLSDISLGTSGWLWDNPDTEVGVLEVGEDGMVVEYPAHYPVPDEDNYYPVKAGIPVKYTLCTHTVVLLNGVEATYTQEGYSGDSYCGKCGVLLEKGTVTPKRKPPMTRPTEAAKPTEPEKPTDSAKPEELEKPTESANPVKPEKPTETAKPMDGIKPTEENRLDDGEASALSFGLKQGQKAADSKTKGILAVTKPGRLINGKVVGAEVQYFKSAQKSAQVAIPDTAVVDGVTCKVTAIAANAFKNDKKVVKVTMGKNVTSVGEGAFYGCKKLKAVTVGKQVAVIGKNAFYGCKKLGSVKIKSTKLKSVGKNAFKGMAKNAVFEVPKARYGTYKKRLKTGTGFKKTMKLKKSA